MLAILETHNISKSFGSIRAVNNANIKIEAGKIHGLIGPNGAGKTTLFNIVAGVYQPDSGVVELAGNNVTGFPAHKMFENGLLRTFQIPHEYSNMTAIENLMMVPSRQIGEELAYALFRPGRFQSQEKEILSKASQIIEFLGMKRIQNELAGNLSGGQKKLLELGRTLMVDSKIVLLDELGAGVNPTLLNTLADNIKNLNRQFGQTYFIIEHNMEFISRLCDKVTVMIEGEVAIEGRPQEVLTNPMVLAAYFGGGKRMI